MKKKIKYIEETYTNSDKTCFQTILIDVDKDNGSNGLHGRLTRGCVRIDLDILCSIRYLTNDFVEVNNEK